MFFQIGREALFTTVRTYFPSAKIENDKIGDGGHIWIKDDCSVAFDPAADGLYYAQACTWEDGDIIGSENFFNVDEFTEYLKNTKAEGQE